MHQLKEGEAGKIILIALSQQKDKNTSSKKQENSTKILAETNKKLAALLQQNSEFSQVQNGQMTLTELIIPPYYQYRYLINNTYPDAQSLSIFSEKNLTDSFKQLLQRLQFMLSPAEQRLFSEDPQMLWLSLLQQWQTQKLQKNHGVWFDHSNQQTLLFVKTQANGFNLQQQQKNIEFIQQQINQLIQAANKSSAISINYIMSGAPVFALSSKQAISKQIKTISVLASITLMAFLFWFFRSLKIVLLISLPLGFAVLTGITCVILLDGFIHGISIAFGVTIIGIAVDYPVHYYSHVVFINSSANKRAIMQSIWPMFRLSLLTTLIGFSAITLSDFSGLHQLGVFAISGLLAAVLFTRFVLPLLAVHKHSSVNHAYEKLLISVNQSVNPLLRKIAIVLPLLALIPIILNYNQLWQKDLSALSPIPQQQKQLDFDLRKAMGLPELRFTLILTASSLETVLQQSEQLKPELNQLVQQGVISAYDMAAHYLPSRQLQIKRQAELPQSSDLQKILTSILSKSDLNAAAFSPFIHAVEKSKTLSLLTLDDLYTEPESNFITEKLKTLIYKKTNKHNKETIWTALIPLQGVLVDSFQQKLQTKAIDFSPAQLLDLKMQTQSMLNQYRNEALLLFFFGLILILLILFLTNRKLADLLALAGPFTGAVILTIASLVIMGYSLSIFHLVTLLLVVGLGIDYSIFIVNSRSKEWTEEWTEKSAQFHEVSQVSVIICTVSTLIMFGALSLSDLPVLKAIGLTASMGAFYAFLLTFLISRPRGKPCH